MSPVDMRQKQIILEFSALNDWEDRYKKVIELGRALSPMAEELKTESNRIKGCQSQVWLAAQLDSQGHVVFQGDSDALIVKGLVALLLNVYSGSSPEDILQNPPEFLKVLGFEGNLSPSRANGLHAMLKQIRFYATAFAYVLNSKQKP
ncbi:MAG: SufE family protein [Bdellovibrionaceae bacterium]|nr:SufE family protein [Pseudobdellovibrionaceae bacterium]